MRFIFSPFTRPTVTPPNNLDTQEYADLTDPKRRDANKKSQVKILNLADSSISDKANAIARGAYLRRAGQSTANSLWQVARGTSQDPLQRSIDHAFRSVRLKNDLVPTRRDSNNVHLKRSMNGVYEGKAGRKSEERPFVGIRTMESAAALARTIYDLSLTSIRQEGTHDDRLSVTLASPGEKREPDAGDLRVLAAKLGQREGHIASIDFDGVHFTEATLTELMPALRTAIDNGTLNVISMIGAMFNSPATFAQFKAALAQAFGIQASATDLETLSEDDLAIHARANKKIILLPRSAGSATTRAGQEFSLQDALLAALTTGELGGHIRIDRESLARLQPALQKMIRNGSLDTIRLRDVEFDSEEIATEFRALIAAALKHRNQVQLLEIPEDPAWVDVVIDSMASGYSRLKSVSLRGGRISRDRLPVLQNALSKAIRDGFLEQLDVMDLAISKQNYNRMLDTMRDALDRPNQIVRLDLPPGESGNIDVLLAALENPESKLEHISLDEHTLMNAEADRLIAAIATAAQRGKLRTLDLETADMTDGHFDTLTRNLVEAVESLGNLRVLRLPKLPADMARLSPIINAEGGSLKSLGVTIPPSIPTETVRDFVADVHRAGLTELGVYTYYDDIDGDSGEDAARKARQREASYQPAVDTLVRSLHQHTTEEGTSLRTLELHCTLENADLALLGEMVASPNSRLTTLSLRKCNFWPQGLEALLSRIPHDGSLRFLDLRGTGVDRNDKALAAIAQARTAIPNLQIITV